VPCISPVLQLTHLAGHEPTPAASADVAALSATFGLRPPAGY